MRAAQVDGKARTESIVSLLVTPGGAMGLRPAQGSTPGEVRWSVEQDFMV